MPEQWVVLLEAADDAGGGPIDADDLHRLHEALEPGRCGGVLRSPVRYALQVTATGAGPVDALLDVVARWADGVRRLGVPAWRLVRTEVFTPEDLGAPNPRPRRRHEDRFRAPLLVPLS